MDKKRNKKILILQNELSPYNVPVYNRIAAEFDLTVGFYQKDKSKQECSFQKKFFKTIQIGSLTFIKGLRRYAKDFDLVSTIPDMHVVSYCLLPFLPHKYKLTNWSIGFRVSYYHPYLTNRKHVPADRIFQCILAHCDASIFYMEKAKEFWNGTSLDMNKVFVAPNTTDVLPIEINSEKKRNFLFVGTLYKGKGLDLLLQSYKEATDVADVDNELHIVGDGEERKNIEAFVKTNHLEGKVILHGAIFDEEVLSQQFANALLCISPAQGGLSVPKSMGYGVPFVTKTTAITGGEIYHIASGVNGIMYENDYELSEILIDAANHPEKYIEMGRKAKDYYDNSATINHMANGAMAAFRFALGEQMKKEIDSDSFRDYK